MNYIEYNYDPTVSAVSVLLMAATVIIMVLSLIHIQMCIRDRALATQVIGEKAFQPVSEETFKRAVEVLKSCEKVICCLENFGTYQESCRQLWETAKKLGKI